ncbi:MAG: hypothetical protein R2762_18310 [Bryobacteraceae bacterium]
MKICRYIPTLAIAAVLFAQTPPAPVITGALSPGVRLIEGRCSAVTAAAPDSISIHIYLNGSADAAPLAKELVDRQRGEFRVELARPLQPGDRVEATQTVGVQQSVRSGPLRVPATPEVTKPLTEGDKAVEGKTAPGASAVEAKVRNAGEATVVQTSSATPAADGTFSIKLASALGAGEIVRLREAAGPESAPIAVKTKPATAHVPVIVAATVPLGGKSATIHFEKLPDSVEKAEVTVTTCKEQKVLALSAEQRKETKVDVPLTREYFCVGDSKYKARLETKTKGAEAKSVEKPLELIRAVLVVDGPVKEGEYEIKGRASAGVTRVRVSVWPAWRKADGSTPPPPTAKSDCCEDLKARIEKLEQGETRRSPGTQGSDRFATLATAVSKRDSLDVESALKGFGSQDREAAERAVDRLVCQEGGQLVQRAKEAEVKGGGFTVELDEPLNAGECVSAMPVYDSSPVLDLNGFVDSKVEIAQSVLLDWGRLRGYFTLGSAVSHNRRRFGEVDTFVGFTADSRVVDLVSLVDKKRSELGMILSDFRWQLNLFTDSRIGVRLTNTGTDSGQGGDTAGVAAAAATSRPDVLDFGYTQPGYVQFGIHTPISWKGMDWRHKGQQYTFFVSPILKAGAHTADPDLVVSRSIRVDPSLPESDTARLKMVLNETRRGALPFYGFGTRVGVFRYDLIGNELRNRQIANDLISYFDITYGQSRLFRTYSTCERSEMVPTCTAAPADRSKPYFIDIWSRSAPRYSIEARLKIPFLPALIGLDANVRTQSGDTDPNELRFVVGFRIDAQKALSRVFGGRR